MSLFRTWVVLFVVNFSFFTSNTIAAQTKQSNGFSEQTVEVYIPLVHPLDKVKCKSYRLCSKNKCIEFLKYASNFYLKVFFEITKDTLKSPPIELYKKEIEIKSGAKTYYKKEWPIYHEDHHLFFVLLLPTNYLRTLSTDGITEILVNNQSVVSFSKKETRQIKDMATTILNNQ